jgi:hypothetical protein
MIEIEAGEILKVSPVPVFVVGGVEVFVEGVFIGSEGNAATKKSGFAPPMSWRQSDQPNCITRSRCRLGRNSGRRKQ